MLANCQLIKILVILLRQPVFYAIENSCLETAKKCGLRNVDIGKKNGDWEQTENHIEIVRKLLDDYEHMTRRLEAKNGK